MASEIDRLLSDIQRTLMGEAWHGPAVRELLDGVTLAQATAMPMGGLHSIAEITFHIAAWTEEVAERFAGDGHQEPVRGNFPTHAPASEEEWQQWQSWLLSACAQLEQAVRAFPADNLYETAQPTLVEGGTPTWFELLTGLAQHNAYHAGQLAVLRKQLG